MTTFDRFNIIDNNLELIDKSAIKSKVDNYFENYINTDMKVLIPDFINQILWFKKIEKDEIVSSINSYIKNHLISRRNHIRSQIKKDNFSLSIFNNFLNTFFQKTKYFNNIIALPNNEIIKETIHQLINLVISDSIIVLFIEEQIVAFDIDSKKYIEELFTFMNRLSKYDNKEAFSKFTKIISNAYKTNIIIPSTDVPLPNNLKTVYNLYESIQYCRKINEYYNFTKEDINIMNYPIIMNYLIEFIQKSTLVEIEYTFSQIGNELKNIVLSKKFDNKNEYLKTIAENIIALINKTLKSNDLNTTDNIAMKIINLLKYMEILIKDPTHIEIINQTISNVLADDKVQDLILKKINQLIRDSKINEIQSILKFIVNIKDKDKFIFKYYQYLIQRQMETFSQLDFTKTNEQFLKLIEIENKIYEFLKTNFDGKLHNKISKVITDTKSSYENNLFFHNAENNKIVDTCKLHVMTTSYSNWGINQTEGLVSDDMIYPIKNTQLGNYLYLFQTTYSLSYDKKRIINWFPHFGEVNITYNHQDIKMLPIQFMILEMFETTENHPIETIMKSAFLSNYTTKFKNDLVGSLVLSGLLKYQGDNLVLTQGNIKNDLIQIFFTTSDYADIWEQQRHDELAHLREDIIKTNINHYVKQRNYNYTDLYDIIKKSIQVFELDKPIFDKSIDYMIKMDYIQLKDNMYEKLIY